MAEVASREAAALSKDEVLRYSRHLIMPEVGLEGQLQLKQAKVLLIGAGGLGSPLALYLAAAGVGKLGVVDFDVVDFTNLQRQVLHGTEDVGRSKLASAAETIRSINPYVEVVPHETRLTSQNALEIFEDYDVIADGTDNFATRYLVNDACVLSGKPNVYGSIFRFEGQASVFATREGPCYRCLYPEPPPPGLVPSCAEGGVLGVLPGIIGTLQALEVIKYILGIGEPLVGRLLLFDALAFEFRELKIRKDANCVVCGATPSISAPIDYDAFCQGPAGESASGEPDRISVQAFAALRAAGEEVSLLDVRNAYEVAIAAIDGAITIPLDELPLRISELDARRRYVVTCHHGPRAVRACQLLAGQGFARLSVLDGGLDAWALAVDPSLPRYG
jgi:sulfur-carrier protein adenylyltransferase/sulfurtransferase